MDEMMLKQIEATRARINDKIAKIDEQCNEVFKQCNILFQRVPVVDTLSKQITEIVSSTSAVEIFSSCINAAVPHLSNFIKTESVNNNENQFNFSVTSSDAGDPESSKYISSSSRQSRQTLKVNSIRATRSLSRSRNSEGNSKISVNHRSSSGYDETVTRKVKRSNTPEVVLRKPKQRDVRLSFQSSSSSSFTGSVVGERIGNVNSPFGDSRRLLSIQPTDRALRSRSRSQH